MGLLPTRSTALPAMAGRRLRTGSADRTFSTAGPARSAASCSTGSAAAPSRGSALVGRPVHGRDAGRPAGPGPALPVHRRLAGLKDAGSVRRHLAEYLARRATRSPGGWTWPSSLAPEGATRAEWLAAAARTAAGVMARKFIAGATPDEAHADRPGPPAAAARLHGRPARRGGDQRGRGRRYQQTCLALIDGLAGPLAKRTGSPADRPRPARPDPAGQPLAQAVEPDGPVRADPRRGDDRPRRRPAAADPPHRPRVGARMFTSTWSSTPTGR